MASSLSCVDVEEAATLPAELILFRRNLAPLQGLTLTWRVQQDGYLLDGYFHFPPGSNGLVDCAISIEISGSIQAKIPVGGAFLALDDALLPFLIDRKVSQGDIVTVEMNNYDAGNPHLIHVPITWSSDRILETV